MKKKFISLFLLCTSTLSLYNFIPVYASDYSIASVHYDENTINQGYGYLENALKKNEPEAVAYDCIPYPDELESLVYKTDNVYDYASETSDKFTCIECKKIYETLLDAYVIYAKKYYNPNLVTKIEAGQKELETKLKETEDKINKVYQENGGGSGAALDIPREQCRLYQTRCHDLIKIYNQERNKPDESEITIAHKVMYNDKTKTGFKYIKNNECIYFENGRMLMNEWKEFDDGYRYFDKNGVMSHDDWVSGLKLNSQGIAADTIEHSGGYHFVPNFWDIGDVKLLTHELRVFDIKCKIVYKDAYDKNKEGKVAYYKVCDEEGNNYATCCIDDNKYKPLTAVIQVYKYTDRLDLEE